MKAYKVSRAALVSLCVASIFAGAVMADPHRLDEVVITAPKSVGELINGNDVPPPPPPITEPPRPDETTPVGLPKIDIDLLKKIVGALDIPCKKATQSTQDYVISSMAICTAKAGAGYSAVYGPLFGALAVHASLSACSLKVQEALDGACS
jgi:hypothetical protein